MGLHGHRLTGKTQGSSHSHMYMYVYSAVGGQMSAGPFISLVLMHEELKFVHIFSCLGNARRIRGGVNKNEPEPDRRKRNGDRKAIRQDELVPGGEATSVVEPSQVNKNGGGIVSFQEEAVIETVPPLYILIVDDSAPSRKMLSRILMLNPLLLAQNLQIVEADDGDVGVEMLDRLIRAGRRIGCVMLDYTMVRMNGPEAAVLMRQRVGYTGLIVSVTGNVLGSDLQRLLDSGVDKVLPKPMPQDKFIQILEERHVL
jgi:CheY-like chemotaxis protein